MGLTTAAAPVGRGLCLTVAWDDERPAALRARGQHPVHRRDARAGWPTCSAARPAELAAARRGSAATACTSCRRSAAWARRGGTDARRRPDQRPHPRHRRAAARPGRAGVDRLPGRGRGRRDRARTSARSRRCSPTAARPPIRALMQLQADTGGRAVGAPPPRTSPRSAPPTWPGCERGPVDQARARGARPPARALRARRAARLAPRPGRRVARRRRPRPPPGGQPPCPRFADRAVVVTGAARGIGRASPPLRGRGRARGPRRPQRAVHDTAAQELGARRRPGRRHRRPGRRRGAVRRRASRPAVDVLVNNAGIITITRLEDLTLEDWERVLAVNTTGTFLCARPPRPRDAARTGGGGRILNAASGQARQGFIYTPHYAASKFGVVGLTQCLAKELAKDRITVNAYCPGIVGSDMWAYNDREWGRLLGDYAPGELMAEWIAGIPLGPRRHQRRRRRPAAVPRLRRGRLHHRPDDQRRRRHVHELSSADPATPTSRIRPRTYDPQEPP